MNLTEKYLTEKKVTKEAAVFYKYTDQVEKGIKLLQRWSQSYLSQPAGNNKPRLDLEVNKILDSLEDQISDAFGQIEMLLDNENMISV